jgi:archaellum component FlaC
MSGRQNGTPAAMTVADRTSLFDRMSEVEKGLSSVAAQVHLMSAALSKLSDKAGPNYAAIAVLVTIGGIVWNGLNADLGKHDAFISQQYARNEQRAREEGRQDEHLRQLELAGTRFEANYREYVAKSIEPVQGQLDRTGERVTATERTLSEKASRDAASFETRSGQQVDERIDELTEDVRQLREALGWKGGTQ